MLSMQLVAAALAATALAASGCGGSSKTTTTETTTAANVSSTETTAQPATTTAPTVKLATGTPLARATLIADGDAICAKANAKTRVLVSSSIQGLTRTYPQIAIYNRTEAAELAKLVPPAALAHAWTQMIDDLELHSKYVIETAHDIESKNKDAGERFATANAIAVSMLKTARLAGFAHCSKLS